MKHISYAGKDLIMGDAAAEALLQFAAELGSAQKTEVVELAVVAGDGDEAIASFLVGTGMDLVAETVNSTMPEPDNSNRVAAINDRRESLAGGRRGLPLEDAGGEAWVEEY